MNTTNKPSSKTVRNFRYDVYGVPLILSSATLVEFGDDWIIEVDDDAIMETLAEAVANKHGRLTGNEVRFLRQYLEHTMRELAGYFDYTAPAVLKWERCGDMPTGMHWATEKDLRLMVLSHLDSDPKRFLEAYRSLTVPPPEQPGPQVYKIVRRNGRPVARCA